MLQRNSSWLYLTRSYKKHHVKYFDALIISLQLDFAITRSKHQTVLQLLQLPDNTYFHSDSSFVTWLSAFHAAYFSLCGRETDNDEKITPLFYLDTCLDVCEMFSRDPPGAICLSRMNDRHNNSILICGLFTQIFNWNPRAPDNIVLQWYKIIYEEFSSRDIYKYFESDCRCYSGVSISVHISIWDMKT